MKPKIGDTVQFKKSGITGTVEKILRGACVVKTPVSRLSAWPEDLIIVGLSEVSLDKEMEEHQRMCDEIMDIQGIITPIEAETEQIIYCPDGYIFKDENGNVINATKIVLEKANTLKTQSDNMETETHRGYCTTEEETTSKSKKVAWFTFWDNDFADKVELDLSNRELIQEDGKWFVVKKKKGYPKTYEECCKIMQVARPTIWFDYDDVSSISEEGDKYECHIENTLCAFRKLLICRDAYWKIVGEEMGLGKPWEPDYINPDIDLYVIINIYNRVEKAKYGYGFQQCVFTFPTPEMRDAFKKNFDPDIEICKEFL